MNNYISYILQTLIVFVAFGILNFFLIKKNILIDNINFSKHKKFINKLKVPISGGIIITISIIFFISKYDYTSKLLILLLMIVGIFSDTNKIKSPLTRFLLQIVIVSLYILINDTFISSIKIDSFDHLLQNNIFVAFLFTSFCLLILINGANFIDGLNLQCSGYFFIILITLLFLFFKFNLAINIYIVSTLLITLSVFIIFNFFSKSFLGDNGSYVLAFIIGTFCINFINTNENISPYYLALLFWYPAFENFFSIIRRYYFNRSKIEVADNYHFHHFLFLLVKEKFQKIDNRYLSSITGCLINIFNLLVFFTASYFIHDSLILIFLIMFSIMTYISIYYILYKKFKNKTYAR